MRLFEAKRKYFDYCLSGDVKGGLNFLKDIDLPSKNIIKFIKRVENRFFSNRPYRRYKTRIQWVRKILASYYDYYIEALVFQKDPKIAEKNLLKSLKSHLGAASGTNMSEVEEAIARKFASIGWHFLGGKTYPYWGPYIYEELEEKKFSVKLPNGVRELPVKLMRKFHSLSWLDYATFGEFGTGGWAKQDGLYCVIEKYDIDSEKFQISYLKHEAQHYDDYIRFPFLSNGRQAILEYRAKLAELIYSSSDSLFKKFMKEAKNDQRFPHLFASFKIAQGFIKYSALSHNDFLSQTVDIQKINEIALSLYLINTNELEQGRCWEENVV